ncbi:MAG: thiamine pyrophosphate-binding protein [Gemmataceae bacterium]
MDHKAALEVIALHRGERIVISTMGSVGVWSEVSQSPLDFAYLPSSMGQGPALAMGLALAHPQRGVIALVGDGSLLMNLGVLVTIAEQKPRMYLVLIDNGAYEITGGQPVPGAGVVDYTMIAKGAGIARTYRFDTLEKWMAGSQEALHGLGPVFIWLKVDYRPGQGTPRAPFPMDEQIRRLRVALGISQ